MKRNSSKARSCKSSTRRSKRTSPASLRFAEPVYTCWTANVVPYYQFIADATAMSGSTRGKAANARKTNGRNRSKKTR